MSTAGRSGGAHQSDGPGAAGTARSLAWLVAGVALFLSPALLGSGLFLARDNGRMHAPVKRFLAGELAAGRLPEWNPFQGLGAPVVAGMVDGLLHPFTALLAVLPAERALTAWVLLALLGAALGAWWWARTLGAGPTAALIAGFGFALAGPLVSATDNVTYLTALATVPAFLAAGQAWVARGGAARLALVSLLSFLLAAAGDAQSWGLALLALPALAASLGERGGAGRRLLRGLGASAAGALSAAPVVLPLALWLPHSSRAGAVDAAAMQRWSLAPVRLLELALPHLLRAEPGTKVSALHQALADPTSLAPWSLSVYLGLTVVVLALVGAWSGRRERLLVAGAAAFGWMALGHHAGFGQLAAHLPVLQGMRYWEKLAPWAALCLAAAAALAADRAWRDPGAARRLAAACGLGAALALAGPLLAGPLGAGLSPGLAGQLADNLRDGALHGAAFAGALAIALLLQSRGRRGLAAAAVALVALDLGAANVRAYELQAPRVAPPPGPLALHLRSRGGLERVLTPFEPAVALAGLTPDEATNLLGARTLAAAWNVGVGVGNFDTYAGAVPGRAAEIERRLSPDRLLPGVGLWGVGHVVVPGRLELGRLAGLREPLQIEADDPAAPAWLVAVAHRPRLYLSGRVRPASPEEALAFALDPASAGGGETVVEGPVPAGLGDGEGQAAIEAETAGRVRISARSARAALLVLNDTWAPGWTARVDGAPAPILRANDLVRGVSLPPGEHQVLFEYRTPGLRAGAAVALAWALGLAVLAWRERRRRPALP